MFTRIRKIYKNWKQKEYTKAWKNGYNWAAGELLRGTITPSELDNLVAYSEDAFDLGALAAMSRLVELKAIIKWKALNG